MWHSGCLLVAARCATIVAVGCGFLVRLVGLGWAYCYGQCRQQLFRTDMAVLLLRLAPVVVVLWLSAVATFSALGAHVRWMGEVG